MTKGKPWDSADEKKLRQWYESGTTDYGVLSFSFDGKYTSNAIYQKLLDLGLVSKEEEVRKNRSSSSTALKLPVELPSIEETLKTLVAALKALETPGLEKSEVLRLRSIITGAKLYQGLIAEYVDYRGLEAELLQLRRDYAGLLKKSSGASA